MSVPHSDHRNDSQTIIISQTITITSVATPEAPVMQRQLTQPVRATTKGLEAKDWLSLLLNLLSLLLSLLSLLQRGSPL